MNNKIVLIVLGSILVLIIFNISIININKADSGNLVYIPPYNTDTTENKTIINDLDGVITDSEVLRQTKDIVDIYIKKYYLYPDINFNVDLKSIKFTNPDENDVEKTELIILGNNKSEQISVKINVEGVKNSYYTITISDPVNTKHYKKTITLNPEPSFNNN